MRPLGVTLTAGFEFLRAALIALFTGGVLFVGNVGARVAGLAAEGTRLQSLPAGFGKFAGVTLLICAAIQLILGIGLLLLPCLLQLRPVSGLCALVNVAVLIYFYLPGTRRYFEPKENAAPNPA